MKELSRKIAAVLADEENPYVYLTGLEFVTLVKSKRVTHLNLGSAGVNRFIEDGGSEYYSNIGCSIRLTRRQALEIAEDFAEREFHHSSGIQLYARVYVSSWGRDGKALYISL